MSIDVISSVWKHSKQRGTALLMLIAIADSANEYGEAWPGIDYLAEKCRMKRRNAQVLIKELEESGELIVARQEGKETPHGKTNLFTIVTPGALVRHGVQSSTPHAGRGAKPYTPGVQNPVARDAPDYTPGVQSSTPNPSLEPSLTVKAAIDRAHDEDPPIAAASGSRIDPEIVRRLKALTYDDGQIRIIIAAAVPRGGFTLADVELGERWLDEQRPEWTGKFGKLYTIWKAGDVPVLARSPTSRNAPRTGPPPGEPPNMTVAETIALGAERTANALKGLIPNR